MSEYKGIEGRDIEGMDEQGDHYSRHVMAMTTESLHSKADIAAELGYRDRRISELERQLAERDALLKIAKCPNEPGCDGEGCIVREVLANVCCEQFLPTGECCGSSEVGVDWEAEQCQWCDYRDALLPKPPKEGE